MKVNIWSDIRCPFCYIGKRKFEAALARFPHKDQVEVVWQSFELDPGLKTQTGISMFDYFAEIKGTSREQAVQMNQQVAEIAKAVGLEFNFENAVVASSFNGHRLIQLAKAKGLASEMEEELFKAQFIEGLNIDDLEVLTALALRIGLDATEVSEMLASGAFTNEVRQDEEMAQSIGIRGVPFFLLNNKYAVSGAQSPETFLQALETAWSEFKEV